MGNTYFSSDLHDGHKAIGKYRAAIIPEIVDPATNREYIADHWCAKKKTDVTWLLGDCFLGKDSHEFFAKLAGKKKYILGNHCLNMGGSTLQDIMSCCDVVKGMDCRKYLGEKFWMTHCPMHPNELRNKKNIHGHIHNMSQDYMNLGAPNYDERYINVNMDVLYPRTGKIIIQLDELSEYMKGYTTKYVYVNLSYIVSDCTENGKLYTSMEYYDDESTAALAAVFISGKYETYKVSEDAARVLSDALDRLPVGANSKDVNKIFNDWIKEMLAI